jgi:hypothetical protein
MHTFCKFSGIVYINTAEGLFGTEEPKQFAGELPVLLDAMSQAISKRY